MIYYYGLNNFFKKISLEMTKQKQFVITASELKDTIPNQYESLYL